jgi:hypothetical protein
LRTARGEENKQFFFEKKNQETFVPLLSRCFLPSLAADRLNMTLLFFSKKFLTGRVADRLL